MRVRVAAFVIAVAAVAALTSWLMNASAADHWFAVHTGTVNEPGPYYAFWSGFGSDIAEFGIIGAVGTGTYQLIRKLNCHEPGCWRVGNHPAAGGQFLLCYRHHPDLGGKRPTSEMIKRLHYEHSKLRTTLSDKLEREEDNDVFRAAGRDLDAP
jgi:hypothetical protein